MGFRIKIVYSNGESEIGYGTDLSKGMRAYVLDSLIDKCSDQVHYYLPISSPALCFLFGFLGVLGFIHSHLGLKLGS